MYCIRCGGEVPTTARFCPGCGAAVPDGSTAVGTSGSPEIPPAGNAAPAKSPKKRRLIGIVGGLITLVVAIGAAWYLARRHPAVGQSSQISGTTAQDNAPSTGPASQTTPVVAGFDWSGLTPEQLHEARMALDAAIAKEEQAAAKNSAAVQPPNGQSSP